MNRLFIYLVVLEHTSIPPVNRPVEYLVYEKMNRWDDVDRKNLDYVLHRFKPVLSVYRTGSTATGTDHTRSDIDYLVLVDSDEHYGHDYVETKQLIPAIDNVVFSRQDLRSPSTIVEGKFDKIAYLMRETTRPRILLHGDDMFFELLDYDGLMAVAGNLRVGFDTMARMKQVWRWE